MADLVPAEDIEYIVGATRHPYRHLARADSTEGMVYVLHSNLCLMTMGDLRACSYSKALDKGIDLDKWRGCEDMAVLVHLDSTGKLLPVTVSESEMV